MTGTHSRWLLPGIQITHSERCRKTVGCKKVIQNFGRKSDREKGAALVFALIVLTVLTMLGMQGMKSTLLDAYVSQSVQDRSYAFESAETGLRLAESIIENATDQTSAQVGLLMRAIGYLYSDSGDYTQDSFWQNINFYNGSINSKVKIVVEPYQTVSDSLDMNNPGSQIHYYKITARGIDPAYETYLNDNNESMSWASGVVILQSIYAKRFTQ